MIFFKFCKSFLVIHTKGKFTFGLENCLSSEPLLSQFKSLNLIFFFLKFHLKIV